MEMNGQLHATVVLPRKKSSWCCGIGRLPVPHSRSGHCGVEKISAFSASLSYLVTVLTELSRLFAVEETEKVI